MDSMFYWGILEWIRFLLVLMNLINMAFVVKQIYKNIRLYILNKRITNMCVEFEIIDEFHDLIKMRTMHLKTILTGVVLFSMILGCIVILLQ